ncbi:MAG: PD40 domain-containing protein [Chloroflexi bacterium]|nr:PD40 domain-containing protein [Chloroflexota bacterium]
MAFTSDLAQNEGTFKAIAVETIAGRETLSVEWTYIQNSLPSWKLWLDRETAVILKAQFFQKSGGEPMMNERVINQVIYNAAFAASLFGIPSVTPQFGDITGTAANAGGTGAVIPSGEDALGQLYFFTLPHQAGQSAQLVRLPGSCAVGLAPCPQLETVSVPFPFNFNLSALSWPPDGRLAAFAYSDNPNGTPTKLWLFDPAANSWGSLLEFPYIDPPFWSPDGTWIAFRVQDGAGGEDVYAVHPDGTELKNLTASGSLPAEGRPYVMDGWLTENVIVRSALPGSTGGVYLLRVSDGAVRPMFETLLTKAAFVVSPDNSSLAYDDYDYNSQKHSIKVVEPDGANPAELITFAGGSVYPIIWSPDAARLAFTHSSSDANFNPVSDVYVIGRDGRGMTQVYKGTTVGRILFSPDGKYLLVEETTSATGGHLFAINLETLEQKIISAPGLSLDADWYAPSWRP